MTQGTLHYTKAEQSTECGRKQNKGEGRDKLYAVLIYISSMQPLVFLLPKHLPVIPLHNKDGVSLRTKERQENNSRAHDTQNKNERKRKSLFLVNSKLFEFSVKGFDNRVCQNQSLEIKRDKR